MRNDERMADELRAFYEERPQVQPDRIRMAHGVLDEIHSQPHGQQTRWWLPSFKRTPTPPTAVPRTEHQPSSIPDPNGLSPNLTGRTQSMFSPVKAVAAGALVFALGGMFLIAQPFGQQRDNVPVAEIGGYVEPVKFTAVFAPVPGGPATCEVVDGVTQCTGNAGHRSSLR